MINDKKVHIPVLEKEVLEYLDPKANENFIDCTIDGGGHAVSILERNKPEGKVLGIEWDLELYKNLIGLNLERLILINESFVNLEKIVEKTELKNISGILLDLGLSSWHLEKSGRGFSFQKDEQLIMRYDGKATELTAEKILNQWPEKEIEKILLDYGEERFAKRITRKIIEERELKLIKTTFQLVEIVKRATPNWYHHRKINFATKTFQALRIVVNDELDNLKKVLPQTLKVLKRGGRLAVISYHSLEDRIVKNFFKENMKNNLIKILTKKPIRPTKKEIINNPRSRSAGLRAMEKII